MMGRVITMARTTLHDLFRGELELYLKSQYPSFNLLKVPNKSVIKLRGAVITKKKQNMIDYILDYCDHNDSALMKLRRCLPSYKNNRALLIKKMRRLGIHNWYLQEDIRGKSG
jgi:hypothetical protein